jgi:ABC-type spermidine/putrescine transport system permease subunit I
MTDITTIGLGFQIMIGLIFVCIAMVYVELVIVVLPLTEN